MTPDMIPREVDVVVLGVGAAFLIDLPELGGLKKLAALGIETHVLMAFEGH